MYGEERARAITLPCQMLLCRPATVYRIHTDVARVPVLKSNVLYTAVARLRSIDTPILIMLYVHTTVFFFRVFLSDSIIIMLAI